MKAFEVSPAIEPLRAAYPPAELLITAMREGNRDARQAIARLWLSEGVPFAFKDRPGLYESLRRWLAAQLDIQAKEITLVGSGRQGFCLSPGKNIGRPFGKHSDLDLTAICPRLFGILVGTFERWNRDYTIGAISPRNDLERKHWDENKESVPIGIKRGFIDPHKIPNWNRYREAQMVAQTMYVAHEKLKNTLDAPAVRRLSIRVYHDWDSFIRQMALNLRNAAIIANGYSQVP